MQAHWKSLLSKPQMKTLPIRPRKRRSTAARVVTPLTVKLNWLVFGCCSAHVFLVKGGRVVRAAALLTSAAVALTGAKPWRAFACGVHVKPRFAAQSRGALFCCPDTGMTRSAATVTTALFMATMFAAECVVGSSGSEEVI